MNAIATVSKIGSEPSATNPTVSKEHCRTQESYTISANVRCPFTINSLGKLQRTFVIHSYISRPVIATAIFEKERADKELNAEWKRSVGARE